ncbi:uncharacterized protein LOC121602967 [Anopheles merus]|uniref:uncharacterized protein LOC121602967 n=1 Tax=Anopheles merus TaxID=30066 RepID=UPI001BE3DC9A|nr:uncharacterized protein LOC121602967 [Anopheles merus]
MLSSSLRIAFPFAFVPISNDHDDDDDDDDAERDDHPQLHPHTLEVRSGKRPHGQRRHSGRIRDPGRLCVAFQIRNILRALVPCCRGRTTVPSQRCVPLGVFGWAAVGGTGVVCSGAVVARLCLDSTRSSSRCSTPVVMRGKRRVL